jgi:MFS transporter, ACS family, hexuronate transporter
VPKKGNVRWAICALLFFATTVNYVDRQVLGVLKPVLERELHWTEADYGWIVFAFQCAYAAMQPLAGRLMDRLGTRIGYAVAVVVWSLASMSHSLARTVWQFALARVGLGIGEAANFPAAIRTVSDWFPKRERAFATGIFNSGSNLGAIAAPLIVAFIAARFGWRATFLVTGALDLVWLVAWLAYFRTPEKHPRVSAAELVYIRSDEPEQAEAPAGYAALLRTRAVWAFLIGKFMTDPVWWFFLFWIPGFLNRSYELNLAALGLPLAIIYIAADVGSIGGGWLSTGFASRGWNLNASRKSAMLICAALATPVISILFTGTLWPAVAAISAAAAAHQGWSANLYTLVSDTMPRGSVGTVVGLGGLAGAVGGMLVAPAVGYWLDYSHGAYRPLFVIAGCAYLTAFLVIQLLVPKVAPVAIGRE